ncbi:hypothetical protein PRIPAC_93701, partial [Pristionchus pacificus]|uniref:Nuclear receptor n=1 Tax=Pristionchus pacificus TaxID=54126 RepID=A0A2A6BBI6_PRIPA
TTPAGQQQCLGGESGRRPTPGLRCALCAALRLQDIIMGYVPSCTPCKTFFRRAIVEKRVYNRCLRSGFCERSGDVCAGRCGYLIPDTRAGSIFLCRSCRYDRCLEGGMNPLLVSGADPAEFKGLDDSGKPSTSQAKPKRRRTFSKNVTLERQVERVSEDTSRESVVPCDPENASQRNETQESWIVPNPRTIENMLEKHMQYLLTMEEAHQKLRISTYAPKIVSGLRIDDFKPGPSKLGHDFGPMQSQPYEPSAVKIVPVEVLIRDRVTVDLSNFDYSVKKLWLFQDKIYSIEYIKALPVYNLLEECSKKALISSGIACANFTDAYYSYTHHSDRTCYPDGSVMTWNNEMRKESPGSTRLYTGIIAAMKEAELDSREYALLKSILICNPLLDGLHPYDVTFLHNEKERCTKTLLSYVLARRGAAKGPAYFSRCLSLVNVTNTLTSWQKNQCIVMLAMGLFKNSMPFAETMYHSH